jgi:hypothetical protein
MPGGDADDGAPLAQTHLPGRAADPTGTLLLVFAVSPGGG